MALAGELITELVSTKLPLPTQIVLHGFLGDMSSKQSYVRESLAVTACFRQNFNENLCIHATNRGSPE
jgi:hypothetical protein